MKKIKQIKINEVFLLEEELKKLKGGTEINNRNTVTECKCTYYNGPSVMNSNSVNGCLCDCVY